MDTSHLPSPPLSTPAVLAKGERVAHALRTRAVTHKLAKASFLSSGPAANASAKLPTATSSSQLLDPVSSDPSEPSPTPPSAATKPIRSHLKPSPTRLLVTLRSGGGKEKEKENRKLRQSEVESTKRSVNFNFVPLASLNASPRHNSLSYYRSTSIYSQTRVSAPSTFVPRDSSSSPVLRRTNKRPADSLSRDDEVPTDDEAEEEDVEYLLLSQDQLSQAPHIPPFVLPPFAAPAPVPRPILKKWTHPILKVPSAMEGCKRNGGRRKHNLSFLDGEASLLAGDDSAGSSALVKEVVVSLVEGQISPLTAIELAGRIPKSAALAGLSSRTSNSNAPERGGDSTRTNAASDASGAGNGSKKGDGVNENGDDDEEEGRRPAQTTPPQSNAIPTSGVTLDDPIHFRVPLATLSASLRVSSREYVRHDSRNSNTDELPPLLPRAGAPRRLDDEMRQSSSSPGSTSDEDDPNSAPTTLTDIEIAYLALVRNLHRLPQQLTSESTTLQPLVDERATLLQCLKRDISNVLSFPSLVYAPDFTPATSSSPPRGEYSTGLPDREIIRQKAEVGVAQVAIKCAAVISTQSRFYNIYTQSELSSLVSLVLRISETNDLRPSVRFDVFPFVSWFISSQRLPLSIISPSMLKIMSALKVSFSTNDKPRHNLSEAIGAIGYLITTHPDIVLARVDDWLPPLVRGLWELPKKSLFVRARAGVTLGIAAKALYVVEGQHVMLDARRRTLGDIFSRCLLKILSEPALPGQSGLSTLRTQMEDSLKTDEAPWVLQILALLPVLLSHRFRRIEKNGIGAWLGLSDSCRHHSSTSLSSLSNLAWNHLAFAFFSIGASQPDEVNWIFREMPFAVLTGIFNTRQVWSEPPETDKDKMIINRREKGKAPLSVAEQEKMNLCRRELRREKAKILATVLSTVLYGLSVLGSDSRHAPPKSPQIQPPVAPERTQFDKYDLIWSKLIKEVVVSAAQSCFDEPVIIAWSILTAIVKPPSAETNDARLEALVNPVFLEDSLSKSRSKLAADLALLAARATGLSVTPAKIPGWSSVWITSHCHEVMEVFEVCLKNSSRLGNVGKEHIVSFWTNFLAAFMTGNQTAEGNASLGTILNWLCVDAEGVVGTVAFKRLLQDLLPVTLESVGDCLIRIPGAETWYPLLVTKYFEFGNDERFPILAEELLDSSPVTLTPSTLKTVTDSVLRLDANMVPKAMGRILMNRWEDTLAESTSPYEAVSVLVTLLALFASPMLMEPNQELACHTLRHYGELSLEDQGSFNSAVASHATAGNLQPLCLLLAGIEDPGVTGFHPTIVRITQSLLSERNIEAVLRILEASSDLVLGSLYPQVYEWLPSLVQEPTSEVLAEIEPLIVLVIPRCFDILATSSEKDLRSLTALHNFWQSTFSSAKSLRPSKDLASILAVIKEYSEAASDFFAPNVGETQSEASIRLQHTTSEESMPPPAQHPRPSSEILVSPTPSTASRKASGTRGYEADVSKTVDSTASDSSSAPPRVANAQPSPSLRAPSLASSPTPISETPIEELQRARQEDSRILRASLSMAEPAKRPLISPTSPPGLRSSQPAPESPQSAPESLQVISNSAPEVLPPSSDDDNSVIAVRRTRPLSWSDPAPAGESVRLQNEREALLIPISKSVAAPKSKRARTSLEKTPSASLSSQSSSSGTSRARLIPIIAVPRRSPSSQPLRSSEESLPPKVAARKGKRSSPLADVEGSQPPPKRKGRLSKGVFSVSRVERSAVPNVVPDSNPANALLSDAAAAVLRLDPSMELDHVVDEVQRQGGVSGLKLLVELGERASFFFARLMGDSP